MNAHRSKGPATGFALLAVLVLLLVLSIIASSVALVSERAVREAGQRVDEEAFRRDAFSTRETVMFLLATQRTTVAGLTVDEQMRTPDGGLRPFTEDDLDQGLSMLPVGNEIRLDGRPYAGFGRVVFALQDGRGLISPNWSPWFVRKALAEQLGADPRRWADIEALRLDFQDADELLRPNGAERRDYVRRGLPPPPDRPITTPVELRAALGWGPLLANLDDGELMRRTTITWESFLNVNTAPMENLALVPGLDAAAARRAVALRNTTPWATVWEFGDAFGVRREDVRDALFLFPNGTGTLQLWDSRGGPVHLLHWTLTGADEGGYTWRLDYDFVLPRPEGGPERAAGAVPTAPFATPVPGRR